MPAGLGVVAIALGVGAPLGLVAGYAGRLADDIIMRLMDCLLAFPGILLAIGIVAILGPSLTSSVIAVGVALIDPACSPKVLFRDGPVLHYAHFTR